MMVTVMYSCASHSSANQACNFLFLSLELNVYHVCLLPRLIHSYPYLSGMRPKFYEIVLKFVNELVTISLGVWGRNLQVS